MLLFSVLTSTSEEILSQEFSRLSQLDLETQVNLPGINKTLEVLNVSPIPMKKRKVQPYIAKKIKRVCDNLNKSLGMVDDTQSDIQATASDAIDIITRLKYKFHDGDTTNSEKLQILTILPSTWSAKKISRVMNSSEHMAKVAKKLAVSNGILAVPISKPRKEHITTFI